MNWLGQLLGSDWEIFPAGGATGDAYYAKHNGQQLFLKRNSSPFLAVLSAEGIVPKLVWTKRMENGDVITAQHWMAGRELKAKDMSGRPVAELLRKIHTSKALLDMLKRLGKEPLDPGALLSQLKQAVFAVRQFSPLIQEGLAYLEAHVDQVQFGEKVVCHCDVNHNNWLLSEDNQLYLIDWDGAMIADPAMDLGPLLYHYVEEPAWDSWLGMYGMKLTKGLRLRMAWYMLSETITFIAWHKSKGNDKAYHDAMEELHALMKRIVK
ncbi:phosphotransferase family protein [Bacillus velezensis]|uniref:phosphotransferase family protein n=1 Tax=Bacillus velezensis TaxID=492670 RepID=UPI000BA4F1FA|nr:phosphotransferase family protein [Bacillus velezensis]MDX8370500.1 phosphotransferase family protein [Bacillus velezensis]PAD04797.1 phosphotransferase [Bacillus velezensis]